MAKKQPNENDSVLSELARREFSRRYLYDYLKFTFQQYKFENWHHKLISDYYQQIIERKILNLMVFLPPRHMKTEGVERAINYAFGQNPREKIISCSYAVSRAVKSSVKIKQNLSETNHKLIFGTQCEEGNFSRQDYWTTNKNGHYIAAGVGGPITGEGFTIGIIDDPIKSREEAESPTYQEKTFDWYEGTFLNRKDEEDSAIILMHTRWNRKDLAGRILAREGIASYNGKDPEGCPEWNGQKKGLWHVLCLPALMEEDFYKWKHEEDPRQVGEYLWKSRYSDDFYKQFQRNKYNWHSLYQQQPVAKGGNLISRDWMEVVENAPMELEYSNLIRFWDIAATEKNKLNDPDFTAGVLAAEKDGYFCILDIVCFQKDVKRNNEMIRKVATNDKKFFGNVQQVWEEQPGAAGKHLNETYFNMLKDCKRKSFRVGKGKDFYIDLMANKMETGQVTILNRYFLSEIHDGNTFLDELEEYPTSNHDDRIDACAKAFFMLAKNSKDEESDFAAFKSDYSSIDAALF